MKHWDGSERTDVEVKPARLSRRDRERLRDLFEPPAHRQKVRAEMGSLIGLALALGVLAALAVTLTPSGPVSPELLR